MCTRKLSFVIELPDCFKSSSVPKSKITLQGRGTVWQSFTALISFRLSRKAFLQVLALLLIICHPSRSSFSSIVNCTHATKATLMQLFKEEKKKHVFYRCVSVVQQGNCYATANGLLQLSRSLLTSDFISHLAKEQVYNWQYAVISLLYIKFHGNSLYELIFLCYLTLLHF